MSSQGYYGEGQGSYGSGYGGYSQQQYPQQPQYDGQEANYNQQYNQHYRGGPNYTSGPPSAQYGEGLGAPPSQHSYSSRPHSPYEGEYNRAGPPQGQYGEPYSVTQQRYSPQPPGDVYQRPPSNYTEHRDQYQSNQYPQTYDGYAPPQGPPPGQSGEEGERGFLGAMAGGAAGAFGGHKMHHGVLGGLGGAVAGSMLEDHFKHKKEEGKEHEQQTLQQQQQQQQHFGGGGPPPRSQPRGNFNGNFSASSTQISLDRDHDLIASCSDVHGGRKLTSVNLNDCLGNEWGSFRWSKGGNFAASARNVRLVDGGRVLEAELAAGDGSYKQAHVFLDERITNEDGELRFLD
ncbi:MAG: hypothetical protein LQ340_005594 [Diploschistes diacapsis]|nr:MAG: hypothetical protein LQ340_005594 [Diploschistes diacapsis]